MITAGTPTTLAARQATAVIPIVFVSANDPVGTGLVENLARPGGNVTGLSNETRDLAGKRLEFLRQLLPNLRRLGILVNIGNPAAALETHDVQTAAGTLGLEVVMLEIRSAEDIAAAFETTNARLEAVYVLGDLLTMSNRITINTWALRARLPTSYAFREDVEAGGLISYGPSSSDLYRRAADYVDKILHGAKPSDIPVEQPTKFDLVINLTTAKALGLEVPPSLLATADEVIE